MMRRDHRQEAEVGHVVGLVEHGDLHVTQVTMPCFMRSSSRPGQATTMSTRLRSAVTWRSARYRRRWWSPSGPWPGPAARARRGSGWPVRGWARGPGQRPARAGVPSASPATSGSANASVLPEPVRPRPRTSRPARVSGSVSTWIGNGAGDARPRPAPRPAGRERPGQRSWHPAGPDWTWRGPRWLPAAGAAPRGPARPGFAGGSAGARRPPARFSPGVGAAGGHANSRWEELSQIVTFGFRVAAFSRATTSNPWKPARSSSDVRPARPDGAASRCAVCGQSTALRGAAPGAPGDAAGPR